MGRSSCSASCDAGLIALPAEILDIDEFVRLSEGALYCRVRRLPGTVKLKLRTKRRLYTLKLEPGRVDDVLKSLKCEVRQS